MEFNGRNSHLNSFRMRKKHVKEKREICKKKIIFHVNMSFALSHHYDRREIAVRKPFYLFKLGKNNIERKRIHVLIYSSFTLQIFILLNASISFLFPRSSFFNGKALSFFLRFFFIFFFLLFFLSLNCSRWIWIHSKIKLFLQFFFESENSNNFTQPHNVFDLSGWERKRARKEGKKDRGKKWMRVEKEYKPLKSSVFQHEQLLHYLVLFNWS